MNTRLSPVMAALAFGSGGLLTLMTLLNAEMAAATTALFSSIAAHGVGGLAALAVLAAVPRLRSGNTATAARAPLWAYLGGLSGALTVILTSTTVNTPLALSGTLALGLLGQAVFALAADVFGWFGMPVRRPSLTDLAAIGLVMAGSLLILLASGAP